MPVIQRLSTFLERHEIFILLVLFLLFILITVPGISWGAPDLWHPDEIVKRADLALGGEWNWIQENFDYPTLPIYVMYAVGKVVYGLGFSRAVFITAARFVSVILGAFLVVLTYLVVRMAGGGIFTRLLAAFLVLSSSEMALNGRFAHNDMYLAFFISLTVFALFKYRITRGKLWLYLSFFLVGLAASSKYNGASLILAPLVVYLLAWRQEQAKNVLTAIETLFIGLLVSAAGYALGTPQALLWMAFYFKRMLPALFNTANYAREPGSLIGLFGQWQTLASELGIAVFVLFGCAIVWFLLKLCRIYLLKRGAPNQRSSLVSILLFSILLCDLPILLSYNYPSRFFLSMIPLLSALSALFVEDIYQLAEQRSLRYAPGGIIAVSILIVAASFPRVASTTLLFQNDARIPASRYVKTLPAGTSIEYTLYPPTIPEDHFSRSHNYPIFFTKFPGQSLPTSKFYVFNEGQAGLDKRNTDYLVIDSFTYGRFSDPFVCANQQVECDFFRDLRLGKTPYKLIQSFQYRLPAYLPQLSLSFLNPDIEIYQRTSP